MPVGFGGDGIKTKVRPLSVMVHQKISIVEVKAENNCLAQALLIALSKLTNDPNYKSYRQVSMIRPVVRHLHETTGIDLDNGAGIPELIIFQEHFHEYKIVVHEGLNCKHFLMFESQVESSKRINLLYDDFTRHYNLITRLTGAMAKRCV